MKPTPGPWLVLEVMGKKVYRSEADRRPSLLREDSVHRHRWRRRLPSERSGHRTHSPSSESGDAMKNRFAMRQEGFTQGITVGSILGIILVVVAMLASCSNSEQAAVAAWGHKHKVSLVSSYDGHVIKSWETSGKIEQEGQSDGIFFQDDATGKLVALYGGPVIVEVE